MSNSKPKFDTRFLKASLLRLLCEPHLIVKFRKYLSSDMFSTGDGKGALKRIASVVLEKVDESVDPTIEGVWAWLQMLPDGQERDDAIEVFNDMRTDEELFRFSRSDQVFGTFLQWLKATAFIMSYADMKERFNGGDFESSYKILEECLGDIKSISLDEVDTVNWWDSYEILENESNRPDRVFKYGIDDFDTSGMEPQMLALFVASTGGGKGMTTMHMIRQAVLQGKYIYVAIHEDRKSMVLKRVYAALTGIPINNFKSISFFSDADKLKFTAASNLLNKYVTIDFIYGQPPDFVFSRFREKQQIRKSKGLPAFEIFVDDYLQHIAHLSAGDKLHEKLASSMAKMKDLCLEESVIGVTFQQINREGVSQQNREGLITLAELSSSFQTSFVADIILTINRTEEMREKDEAVLYVVKGREGNTGHKYQVKTEFASARFNFSDYMRIDKLA